MDQQNKTSDREPQPHAPMCASRVGGECTCGEFEAQENAEKKHTAESVGNQHGYLCPTCKEGDHLTVEFTGQCRLFPDGTDDSGDHEWDDESSAWCGCGWAGKIKDLTVVEIED